MADVQRPVHERARRPPRWIRVTAILALVAASLLPTAGPVIAAPSLTVTPSSGTVGATLVATASGFTPGLPVKFLWDNSNLLGSVNASAGGGAALKFSIPATAPGEHFVRACQSSIDCPPDPNYADDAVTVLAPSPPPPPTPTPTATPRPTRSPTPPPTATPVPSFTPTVAPTPAASAAPSPSGTILPPPPATASPFPIGVPTQPPATIPPIPSILTGARTIPPGPDGFQLPIPDDFPDLWLYDMEVTQGIQNLENAMPLVAARRTYVRLYFRVVGADDWLATYGALHATRNGQSLGWIWPDDGAMVAYASGSDRLDPDTTLDFRLPEDWTHGTVKFTGFVYSWDPDTPWEKEPDPNNNIREATLTFHDGEPLTVHYATLHLHEQYRSDQPAADYGPNPLSIFGPLVRTSWGFLRYHPISDVNVSLQPWVVYPSGHAGGHEFDLGFCTTTISGTTEYSNVIYIPDWSILVDDPSNVPESKIQVTHDTFYIDGDGTGVMAASIEPDGSARVTLNGGVFDADDIGKLVAVGGCSVGGDAYSEPNVTLGQWRLLYDWSDEREFFVGMVDPDLYSRWGGLSTGNTDTVWIKMDDGHLYQYAPWNHTAAAIAAHETGHAAGLKHVACKDEDHDGVPDELAGGALDLTHPETEDFPECSLADVDPAGFYGFDVYHDLYLLDDPIVLSNDPEADPEHRAFPFMSYRGPAWPDPYHYCRLLPYYGVPCDPDEVGIRWNHPVNPCTDCDPFTIPPVPVNSTGPLVLVTGLLGPGDGPVSILQTLPLPEPSEEVRRHLGVQRAGDPADASMWLVVRTRDGTELRRDPVQEATTGHGAGSGDAHPFTTIVELPRDPAASGVGEITLEDSEGNELTRIPISRGAPIVDSVVATSAPNRTGLRLEWHATDPDGDPLTYVVVYTPDGENWETVSVDLHEPVLELTSLAGIAGSSGGRFRVVASDGVLVGFADSDPLVIPGAVPEPLILFPPDGGFVPLHGTVVFEGQAFDLEDRRLDGDALSWSSSIDGLLGTGVEVRTSGLSAGRHTIVLTATDSDGGSAVASIELVVDGSVVQVVSKPETDANIDRIFAAIDEGRDPARAGGSVDEHPDFAWLPIGIAMAVILTVGLAALAMTGRLPRLRLGRLRPGK